MYLLSATGASKLEKTRFCAGSCRPLSVEQLPRGDDVGRCHRRAVREFGVGVDAESKRHLVGRDLPVRGEARRIREGSRVQHQEGFVHHRIDHLVPRRDVRSVVPQRRGKVRHVRMLELAAFDRSRIADQVVVGAGLPALAFEAFAPLLCRNRRIGARVSVGEDGIGILVERYVRGVRGGRWGSGVVCGRGGGTATARGRHQNGANDTGHQGMRSSHINLQFSILLRDQRLNRRRRDRSGEGITEVQTSNGLEKSATPQERDWPKKGPEASRLRPFLLSTFYFSLPTAHHLPPTT